MFVVSVVKVRDILRYKIVICVSDGKLRIMHSSKVRVPIDGDSMLYCHHSSHSIHDAPTFKSVSEYIKHLIDAHGDDEAMKIVKSLKPLQNGQ